MKLKNYFDIFTTIIMLLIVIGFLKSKVVILQIDAIEMLEFIASVWAIIRLGSITINKIKGLLLENKIKRKKKYYR